LISTISERLQSPNWQAIQSNKSMATMFENMDTRVYQTGNDNTRRVYGGYQTQEEQVQPNTQTPTQ